MDIKVCPTTAYSLDTKSPDGPVRELNPGPLAPYARILPLDQQAILSWPDIFDRVDEIPCIF